jgi:NAD(P)-dependent dehydrogenase (short-subunit alcohol dehydrogenase family)
MSDRLKDKVALVSGAGSSGPGWGNSKATAVLFAREGARVLAADINLDAAIETKRIIEGEGGICEAASGDVSLAADVATIVDACIAAFGRIDVLHNNVGIVEVGGPVETTEEAGTGNHFRGVDHRRVHHSRQDRVRAYTRPGVLQSDDPGELNDCI